MLEPHIHISSQPPPAWAGRRILSKDKREDNYIQVRRWKSCAMHSQGAGRGQHNLTKWGRRAVYDADQGQPLLSEGSAYTNREAQRSMFDLASLPAVPCLPQPMLTTQMRLAVAGYECYRNGSSFTEFAYELPLHCAKEKADKALSACFTELVWQSGKRRLQRAHGACKTSSRSSFRWFKDTIQKKPPTAWNSAHANWALTAGLQEKNPFLQSVLLWT